MSFYGKKVGKFTVSVSDPYPAWVRLACENRDEWSIHPDELEDLAYAVEAAKAELKRMNELK